MRKGLIALIALIAICITIGAASAADWSFNIGSDTNSDGGSVQINNNELKIQDEKFTIPDGYKENETARLVGNQTTEGSGAKISACELDNGNKTIIVKVLYADGGIDNATGPEGSENATVSGHSGYLKNDELGTLFGFMKDGKLIEIRAPSQAEIESVLK